MSFLAAFIPLGLPTPMLYKNYSFKGIKKEIGFYNEY